MLTDNAGMRRCQSFVGPRHAMLLCRGTPMARAMRSCSTLHQVSPTMSMGAMPSAYVYCGPGAGFRSALSAVQSLRDALIDRVRVSTGFCWPG